MYSTMKGKGESKEGKEERNRELTGKHVGSTRLFVPFLSRNGYTG